jgi:multiple sugar transport system ATP-binding protein
MKLVLHGVRKAYSDKALAVDGVDFQVDDGQMAVLLGPSGCGKTTLLRLICGLETPDKGSIILDDKDITNWEPKRRDVAMVFQNYALYPHMTVAQNLEFGLKSRHVPINERVKAVEWAAGLLGLSEMLERKPKELSGGQRQRVALGRAIVRKPRLYLYDEPLSNLDAELRMRMRGEILLLHRRVGGTSIYVTHDQVEAMSLADIIFIMRQGKIISTGSPKDLYANPPDLFTAGFLGFPAMNLIEGALIGSGFISAGGLQISIASEKIKQNKSAVVLGIRPEDITISDSGPISGEIISIENLGRQELLLLKTTTDDRLKLVAQGIFHVGDMIKISMNMNKSYLFEKAGGKRIVVGTASRGSPTTNE